jgi:hypothetical protein
MTATVRRGQVWQDNDPRSKPGRTILVLSTDERYAYVKGRDGRGGFNGRASRLLLTAFKASPARTGYRLVSDNGAPITEDGAR